MCYEALLLRIRGSDSIRLAVRCRESQVPTTPVRPRSRDARDARWEVSIRNVIHVFSLLSLVLRDILFHNYHPAASWGVRPRGITVEQARAR